MAKKQKRLLPPHPGWHEDKRSRGWYSPNFASFQDAKIFGNRSDYVTHREYIDKYQWNAISVHKKSGTVLSDIWRVRYFRSQAKMEEALRTLPAGAEVEVVAFGTPSQTSPPVTVTRNGKQIVLSRDWRTIYSYNRAGDYNTRLMFAPNFGVLGQIYEYAIKLKG